MTLAKISPCCILNFGFMKFSFLIFNGTSFYFFIEYFRVYVNVFLKNISSLITLDRIAFLGIFAIACFMIILLLPKQTILDKKEIN